MRRNIKSLLMAVAATLLFVGCEASDNYKADIGLVDNTPTNDALDENSLNHPADKEYEGYYIANKYWYSGELVTNNTKTGEIWSFEAKAGQSYAVYLYGASKDFYVFEGTSKTSFKSNYLLQCEKVKYYNSLPLSNDLYGRPAIVTPETDGKFYLKVTGSASSADEYSCTGKYDICVTKGRDGESFVALTLESVASNAWIEDELEFNIKDGWYDYENYTTSDWVDYNCYLLEVNAGDKVILFGADKTNSTCTAKTGFSANYWNGTEYERIFKDGYEYADNDSFIDGYPFTVPADIALEEGKDKKYIYWYVAPSLEDGATKITNDGENIGTYRVAAKINDKFVEFELYKPLCAYQYQLVLSDAKKLAVGAVLNPFEFASLKKWDGTFVDAKDENLYIYWGNGFEKLTNYIYLLCKEEKTHTYLQFSYPKDGETYYYYKYLNILAEDKRAPQLKINIADKSLFCVGNYVNTTLYSGTKDVTSSAVWTWYNPNAEKPTITDCDEKGVIPCHTDGSLYIIVQDGSSGDIVYKEVTVKPASENPYQITVESGSVDFLNTATFALRVNSSDVSNSAVWSCSDSIDFDADTRTAIFYASGTSAYIYAEYNGVKTYYKCTVEDRDTYDLTFDMPLDKIDFGSAYSTYTINLSGTYDETKFNALRTKFESFEKPFALDMSGVTGITVFNKPNEDSNDGLFAGCSTITSLKLPESLTSLGVSCLRNCTSLVSVIIPSSVTSFENYVFSGCTSLISITIPEGVSSIGNSMFYGCTSLTSVSFPSTLTTIGSSVFSQCSGLTSMTIPDTVTDLSGSYTFSGCTNLVSVSLPDNCMTTMIGTFQNCSSLISITVPTGVTTLETYVFEGCTKLSNLTLPYGITSIGGWCFRDCSSLKTVILPSSLTSIANYCFADWTGLTSINIPNGITALTQGCFSGCTNLSNIALKDTKIVSIRKYAFSNCTSLQTLIFPWNYLQVIEQYAFSGCTNLSSVTSSRTWSLKTSQSSTTVITKVYGSSAGASTLAYYLRDKYKSYYWYR